MSYSTIYYASFNDNVNEDRIDIYIKQDGFTGEPSALLLDSNPLVITYPTKDFDSQIFGCGAEINVINNTGNFSQYDTLFSVPERSNYIEIIKTPSSGDASIFIFQGYILPDMYSSRLGKNTTLTIPATDRLSTLDRYTPWILVDTSSYRAHEYLDALSLTSSILYDADITNTIKINNTLQNVNYQRDPSNDTIFNNIFFQADNFQDADKIENDKEVLEKILQVLYSRAYYFNNAWYIERLQNLTQSRNYTVYPKESSIYSEIVPNTIIDLSCTDKKTIANSAEISFNPGNSKLIVNLKFKKPESLVENFWSDYQYYTKEVSVDSLLPLPKQRRWMTNGSSNAFLIRPEVAFSGIDNCYLLSKQWGLLAPTDADWFEDFFSTNFVFSPKSSTSTDPTIITYSYKRGFHPTWAEVATSFASDASQNALKILSRIALRACDNNGNDHWIAKSNPDDVSTYWSDTVYTFDVSTSWEDIKENNFIWEISDKIDISYPVISDTSTISYSYWRHTNEGYWFYPFIEANPKDTWVTKTYEVPSELQYIGSLYLDVYDVFHDYRGSKSASSTGWYYSGFGGVYTGDFDVDAATPTYPDMLEASMGYFYNTLSKDLHIFDTSTVQYTNGIYNLGDDDLYRSIWKWRDAPIEPWLSIQEQYMNDLSQQVAYARYKFNVDVLSNDSSLFSIGYLYKHESLKYPDDTDILFMCNGLQYNVKQNAYRLSLEEYIADESYRLPEKVTEFTYEPSEITFDYDSTALTDNNVDVTTNMYYAIDTSEDWIYWTANSSNNITIDVSYNSGSSRDGSVWFIPDSSYARAVSVHQNEKVAWLTFLSSGDVSLGGITEDESIDFEGEMFGSVSAESQPGYGPYTGAASFDWRTTNIIDYSVTVSDGDSSTDSGSNQFQANASIGQCDGASWNCTGSGGDIGGSYDGDGYIIINSAVIHGTTTDVSLIYNKLTVNSNLSVTLSYV